MILSTGRPAGRAWWLWGSVAAQGLLAAALCFVPLFDLLGYELAFAVGLLAAVTGMVIGLGAGRAASTALGGFKKALLLGTAQLILPLGIMSLNALRVPNCNFGAGLAFFALLPLPTALYAAALGSLVARLFYRSARAVRATVAVIVLVAPLLWSLWLLYSEPPIFAFDHLWGHFAGSLYDEVVTVDSRLLVFRLGTLLRVAAVGLLLWAWQRRRRLGTLKLAGAAGALLLAVGLFDAKLGPVMGFRVRRADIERALPVTVERPGLVIHLPAGTGEELAARIADEHAFRLDQLSRRLGVRPPWIINSYVYANAAQKQRLMGGSSTMVSKPWLHEIHIHPAVSPQPILAHELAHAVAASFGAPPLRLAARHGVLVNMGLVEGLAEAVTPERGTLDLDHWTRAMRQLGVAPDVRSILGTAGFWTQPAGRAYTVAGSFVRYLFEEYGAARVRRVYRYGDFQAAFGRSLDTLVSDWEARIDAIELTPLELRAAQERFRKPSIFARTCAHEVARLRHLAARASGFEAVALYKEVARHLGESPSARLDVALALHNAGADAEFLELSRQLLDAGGLDSAQRSQLLEQRGMTQWKRGDKEGARGSFREALELATTPAAERLQWVRLWGLGRPEPLRSRVRGFLSGELAPLAACVELVEQGASDPGDKVLPYLVGRQLARVDDCEGALEQLDRASGQKLPAMESERMRMKADCLWKLGRLGDAEAAYQAYAEQAPSSGERARSLDWVERIQWRRKHPAAERTGPEGIQRAGEQDAAEPSGGPHPAAEQAAPAGG